MSADCTHFGPRLESLNTILEIDQLMTCLLYWLTGFSGEYFKTFFPIGYYVKTIPVDGGGRNLIMDQDELLKITDHRKLQIRNHDKKFPFLPAITGHDRIIDRGSRYLKYPIHRSMKIPPLPAPVGVVV